MGELNLIAFNDDYLEKIIKAINLSIDEHRHILDEEGKPAQCESCDCEITTDNLGNIMPGSKLFYCDNSACFTKYIQEHVNNG